MIRLFILFASLASPSLAQTVDYDALDNEGYGEVGEILRGMSEEDRQDALEKANAIQKELELLDDRDIQRIKHLLKDADSALESGEGLTSYDEVNPSDLSVEQTAPETLAEAEAELDTLLQGVNKEDIEALIERGSR